MSQPGLTGNEPPPSTTIVKPGPDEDTGARIGVLFVHGMGEQQRGGTLQQFAEPVIQWLRRWESHDFDPTRSRVLEPDPAVRDMNVVPLTRDFQAVTIPTSAPLGYTVIRGEPADPSCYEPPTTEITLTRPAADDGKTTRATWVMSEAFWADSFFPPKFSDVARWGLGVGPRFIVRHFELSTSGLAGWPQFLRYGVALAGVLLFELVIVLLLLLGALPFARNYVRTLILRLIGSFGDPMVLVASPLTSGAIMTALANALTWLRDTRRCQRIAIVAHSLGTVASYNLLARDSERVGLFVTFGSALKKAQILQKVQQNDRRLSLGVILAGSAFAAFASAALIALAYWSELPSNLKRGGAWSSILAWLWPYLMIVGGSMLCIARIALWRRLGPRWVAPAGCLVAALGAAALLAYRPTAADPAPWDELGSGPLREVLTDPDLLRVAPFVVATMLMGWREVRAARRFRNANAAKVRAIETEQHPLYLSGPLIQALLIAGTVLACVTRVWTPPELLAPLAVTGLVLCYSAIRVPFGDGYVASDGEHEDEWPFPFALDKSGNALRWRDFWATSDPVPDGGFGDGNVEHSPREVLVESTRTTNQRSLATDHTTYEENLEQFVSPLVGELMQLSGWTDMFANAGERRVAADASHRRDGRVAALSRSILLLDLSAGAAIAYLTLRDIALLTQIGNKALAPVMAILRLVLDDDWVTRINELFPGAAFGALLIGLVAVLWHRLVVFQAWRQWDKADQSATFQRCASDGLPRWVHRRRGAFQVVAYVVPVIVAGAVIALSAGDVSWWPTS
jgi:hypothetical protein